MKRGRICTVTYSNDVKRDRTETRGEEEVSSIESTQYSGSSFSGLPRKILLNILLRLSIKSILVCKFVCKTWYDAVLDPEFAKLHYDQTEVYPLIQRFRSRILYLVEPDKDDFDPKLGMCDHTFSKHGCVCNVQLKIDTKLEITRRKCVKSRIKVHEQYKYNVVNSCNGLLCMYDPYTNYPPIVCNPVTGEFVNLPEAKKRWGHYGFGYSPATNQYKVIRVFEECGANFAEVHVLGTKTWKDLGCFPKSMPKLSPCYLNGFLYWFSFGELSVFDVERERFGSVSGPTGDLRYESESTGVLGGEDESESMEVLGGEDEYEISMGVLGGEVCIFRAFESGAIHVWAMKDCGTEKAWSKVFSFDMNSPQTRYYGQFRPIKYLDNGALLLFYSDKEAFLYMDPSKNRFRYLKIRGTKSKVEAIGHIPSFVSLKHALVGHNVKVLNFRSRCAELKLHGEAKNIDMVEDFDPDYDSNAMDIDIYEVFDFDFDSDLELDSEFDSDSSSDYV